MAALRGLGLFAAASLMEKAQAFDFLPEGESRFPMLILYCATAGLLACGVGLRCIAYFCIPDQSDRRHRVEPDIENGEVETKNVYQPLR